MKTRTWIKPTANSLFERKFNAHTTIELNTEPATEDAAIDKGWYPQDGEVAGTERIKVPKPAWLTAGETKKDSAKD